MTMMVTMTTMVAMATMTTMTTMTTMVTMDTMATMTVDVSALRLASHLLASLALVGTALQEPSPAPLVPQASSNGCSTASFPSLDQPGPTLLVLHAFGAALLPPCDGDTAALPVCLDPANVGGLAFLVLHAFGMFSFGQRTALGPVRFPFGNVLCFAHHVLHALCVTLSEIAHLALCLAAPLLLPRSLANVCFDFGRLVFCRRQSLYP